MSIKNKIAGSAMLMLAIAIIGTGCQKMDRPALGDYPKDANPPGGPLKFFAAYENTNVDSIRANFGSETNVTYVDGVSGKAMKAGTDGYIMYPSANDFKKSTSFTVAFWMKRDGPNPASGGSAFPFGLSTTQNFWHQMDMFFEFEDAGNPSSAALASAKFCLRDQWYEFTGARRIPNLLNNQWHHLAFSFDAATSTISFYVDGAVPAGLPDGFGKFNNDNGVPDFSKSGGIVVGGAGHYALGKQPDDWMKNFNGEIDQFRLYGVALSAAEVKSLYDNKQ